MRQRPLSVKLISLLCLLMPPCVLWMAARVSGLPLAGNHGIFHHMAVSDGFVLALFPVVAAGVYSVRRWGWYLYVGFAAFLIPYTLRADSIIGSGFGRGVTLFFIAAIVSLCALFFRKHVYSPYFDPRLRWWESAPRYRINLNTRLFTRRGEAEAVVMKDISTTGCFVDLSRNLAVGERVWIVIECASAEISCMGRVVRAEARAGVPRGYGVMFDAMNRENRTRLDRLIRALVHLRGQDRKGRLPPSRVPAVYERLRRGRFFKWGSGFRSVLAQPADS
jgi:PilZ domain-containing protein